MGDERDPRRRHVEQFPIDDYAFSSGRRRRGSSRTNGPLYTSLGHRPRGERSHSRGLKARSIAATNDRSGFQPSIPARSEPWAAPKAGIERAFGPKTILPELKAQSSSHICQPAAISSFGCRPASIPLIPNSSCCRCPSPNSCQAKYFPPSPQPTQSKPPTPKEKWPDHYLHPRIINSANKRWLPASNAGSHFSFQIQS